MARLGAAHSRYAAMRLIERLCSLRDFSQARACEAAGVSLVTYWRWRKAYQARGFSGLLPQTSKCGRRASAARPPKRGSRAALELVCPVEIQAGRNKAGRHTLEVKVGAARWAKQK